MKERPIIYSAPMVNATLDGRKTQTRRIIKPQPNELPDSGSWSWAACGGMGYAGKAIPQELSLRKTLPALCPYGNPGDRLWVRENLIVSGTGIDYAASPDTEFIQLPDASENQIEFWDKFASRSEDIGLLPVTVPSIFCPRWASRIDLLINNIRIERLHDITEEDAKAEGAAYHDGCGIGHSGWRHDLEDVHDTARSSFACLWNKINGADAWDKNPWVWVIEFERTKP